MYSAGAGTVTPFASPRNCALAVLLASTLAVCAAHGPPSAFALNAPLVRKVQRNHAQVQGKHRLGPLLGLRASMRDYRKSFIKDKENSLQKLSRQVFNLQDALLQLGIMQDVPELVIAKQGPPQPSPNHTAVVGTGPAGLATAIMLAR